MSRHFKHYHFMFLLIYITGIPLYQRASLQPEYYQQRFLPAQPLPHQTYHQNSPSHYIAHSSSPVTAQAWRDPRSVMLQSTTSTPYVSSDQPIATRLTHNYSKTNADQLVHDSTDGIRCSDQLAKTGAHHLSPQWRIPHSETYPSVTRRRTRRHVEPWRQPAG